MQVNKVISYQLKVISSKAGFTLIELLVVMAILGILSTLGLGSFRSSQLKGRDSRRRLDLANIQKSLEMYQNDYKLFPLTGSFPSWGAEFSDVKGSIYIKEVPKDPSSGQNYVYVSSDGSWYKLYAKLENTNDYCFTSLNKLCKISGFNNTNCGGGSKCNYIVPSSNVLVTEYDN